MLNAGPKGRTCDAMPCVAFMASVRDSSFLAEFSEFMGMLNHKLVAVTDIFL